VSVIGKVTKGGKDYALPDKYFYEGQLIPEGPHSPRNLILTIDKDGKFSAQNVPAGRYKISVQIVNAPGSNDLLKNKFAPDKTKISREIDGKPLEIDLDKDAG